VVGGTAARWEGEKIQTAGGAWGLGGTGGVGLVDSPGERWGAGGTWVFGYRGTGFGHRRVGGLGSWSRRGGRWCLWCSRLGGDEKGGGGCGKSVGVGSRAGRGVVAVRLLAGGMGAGGDWLQVGSRAKAWLVGGTAKKCRAFGSLRCDQGCRRTGQARGRGVGGWGGSSTLAPGGGAEVLGITWN